MKLQQFIEWIEHFAPPKFAEPWDNVGLLAGDPEQEITRAMLCIDYESAVAEEAKLENCELVIAYHPPIFKPLTRINSGSLVFDAIRRGVAIYSPHTALDVADGGTNDVLADLLGLVDRKPLKISESKPTHFKLATFVPEKDIDSVARALFQAGAGQIGNYSNCSFRAAGTGTFFGEAGSNPAAGQAGKLERVQEIKLETIVPIHRVDTVISALRASHPYEEPAFDLLQLSAEPAGRGVGRVGRFENPVTIAALSDELKRSLGVNHLLIAGDANRSISTAAVCAGAGGDFVDDAIARKVDLYLTGELRHHDAIKAIRAGLTVICTLHSNSERITLSRLADRLSQALPAVAWRRSQADRDPFEIR